jgi:hypothetical protein
MKKQLSKLTEGFIIGKPEYNWHCCLFGGKKGDGVMISTVEAPNWFWRQMQYLLCGNRWTKIDKESSKLDKAISKIIRCYGSVLRKLGKQ